MTNPAIRAFRPDDAPAALELWKGSLGERYLLRPDVLELSVVTNPHARPGDAAVAQADGRLIGFAFAGISRSEAPELAAERGQAWLQAVVVAPSWRRRGVGRALVRAVAPIGRETAADRLTAGGGLFYLWPGVPEDLPAAAPFLEGLGFRFEPGPSYDLRGDVSTMPPLEVEGARAVLAAAGLALAPARDTDRDPMLRFLLAEFGGAWWHDVGWFLEAGGEPGDVLLLRTGEGASDGAGEGSIRGFARIHTPASRPPGWPMYWRADSPTAGGLGPIGIAAALRGRGLGRALLVLALDRLGRLGHPDVVIDDTTLLGYYGPHGFAPWITYRHATAPLGSILAGADAPSLEDR
ncbi:MAG: GNAT family N-acetyltransferase [Chloroflexota bacterium]